MFTLSETTAWSACLRDGHVEALDGFYVASTLRVVALAQKPLRQLEVYGLRHV